MSFKFEKLNVWDLSIELSNSVHQLTKKFPKDELFILTSQIKRAADSITLNIAEGSTGQTNDEFKRFLSYSIRSAAEVVACLYLGKKREIINIEDFNKIYIQTEEIIKKLQALKNSIK
ncbi:MAG: four helix bundle protein [Bacteroidetes bacterium]|nr:four helix bundle protein [Bacteroidota bacterium]